ncbi:phage holin family protein [Halomonas sp. McH1-25]|uniref:phage holin family protein n=1 Tax=unclassified Halomonas TaxID=2609666 RepID=UPI001EF6BF88|nr:MULTISPECIES: phage holin family protein [unclassified Halomonas]MCG7598311.1 phage holin family protein [Halomonas sp. McH1-25]MCP1340906.1 phage holin family protein [Halomonas sp. FL8]MCP1361629.1 phage holin family protein [Halomonas sp. BBD45]
MDEENRNRTGSASLGSLLSSLTHELTSLVRKEIELAKAEMGEKGSQAASGVGAIAAAGAILLSGFLVLLAAAVFGLNTVLPPETTPWLSALIVGGVVVIIGLIMLQSGRKKLKAQSLMPSRTMASLRNDKELASQHEHRAKEQV